MPKDKRIHINDSVDIASAWETGKPLAALCGVIRTLKPETHDKRINAPVIDICDECTRIAVAFSATGQAEPLGLLKTAQEIKATTQPRDGYYAVTYTSSNTWNY